MCEGKAREAQTTELVRELQAAVEAARWSRDQELARIQVSIGVMLIFFLFFALTVIPGPALFSLTIRLRNPFPCPVTFVTGQRLLC